MLSWPMIAFGWVTNMLQRGMASWKRMLEILDVEPAIADTVRLKADTTYETAHAAPYVVSGFSRTLEAQGSAPTIRGEIEFRDLTFGYGGAAPVLDHVSARIQAGQTVALVGITGSGKSTLISLLARLHDPPAGTVFIDGVDVREIPLGVLRAAIGFVPQEPFLFSDTLADNVAFGMDAGDARLTPSRYDEVEDGRAKASAERNEGDPRNRSAKAPAERNEGDPRNRCAKAPAERNEGDPRNRCAKASAERNEGDPRNRSAKASAERNERVLSAAAVARLDKDVADFPKGYETMVGERGITLSGGQKQRTALARAIAVDPRILVLDDALSAVDTYTEEEILTRLRGVTRERTAIIVSHRISTVREADLIFVLDGGRIAERGTHDELIRHNGLYAELHKKQLLEEELAAS
jgi:ATP-binding cassette subfamily B multidrug efflux pump